MQTNGQITVIIMTPRPGFRDYYRFSGKRLRTRARITSHFAAIRTEVETSLRTPAVGQVPDRVPDLPGGNAVPGPAHERSTEIPASGTFPYTLQEFGVSIRHGVRAPRLSGSANGAARLLRRDLPRRFGFASSGSVSLQKRGPPSQQSKRRGVVGWK